MPIVRTPAFRLKVYEQLEMDKDREEEEVVVPEDERVIHRSPPPPPGGEILRCASHRMGNNLICTGWANADNEMIYLVGGTYITETQARERKILSLEYRGGDAGKARFGSSSGCYRGGFVSY